MNDSERTVCEFLKSLRIGSVVFEPDGNQPPDFVVDGRIAVEARRLNESELIGGVHRGLEVTAKPLHKAVVKALAQSGPVGSHGSWFVHYSVRRPLPPWRSVERLLRDAVRQFRDQVTNPPAEIRVGQFLKLAFHRASNVHDALLLLGGSSDYDEGGFLVTEVSRNFLLCIAEKKRKLQRVKNNYAEWWLVFEDRISYGFLEIDDIAAVRAAVGQVDGFARVILVNPLEPTQGLEVW